MSPFLSVAISIAAVLLIGNLLIVSHELGHYGAARAVGVTARRFAIGVGPRLMRRVDRRGTEWSLALLPVGGYVSFPGEKDPKTAGSYAAQPPLARIAIIAAGPLTNLVLAFLVFMALLGIRGTTAYLPIATTVVDGSAAQKAGFKPGDRIVAVDSRRVKTFEELRPVLQASAGKLLDIEVMRGANRIELRPVLGSTIQDGQTVGYLGIQSKVTTHVRLGLVSAGVAAAGRTWGAIADTVHGVTQAVTTGRGTQNFAGVLGITQLAGQAAVAGDSSVMTLIAVLSANLALMNLLPIPVLDGGALLFCAFEWLRGRPASLRLQDFATRTGVAAIATMFMLSMLHDLSDFGLFDHLGRH